ncbi:WD40-repeat-containing domain protein [Calycina marina]|uniref:WD40-repeat-containing domain protein n=1 Tax=Calycina marina TaxID=1763456 RepID=A0A9P7Z1L5_9HELO|nr:WD40-repeat-containing domain protein [Calycina marina]
MRFLQTEWHRHERDRNGWEIERQEMKSRIAKLEGSTRKLDTSNLSLNKYVSMLEKALRERDAQVKKFKAGGEPSADQSKDKTSSSKTEAKTAPPLGKPHNSFLAIEDGEGKAEDDPDRGNVKTFMDKTQGELTYLMVAPSNPLPPRDHIQLDDMVPLQPPTLGNPQNQQSLEEIYPPPQPRQKNNARDANLARSNSTQSHQPPPVPISSNIPIRSAEPPPMSLSLADQQPLPQVSPQEWPPTLNMPEQIAEDQVTKINHTYDSYGRAIEIEETPIKESQKEIDAWDFDDATELPEPGKPVTQRPDTDLFPVAQDLPKSPSRGIGGSHRRKGSMSRRKSADQDLSLMQGQKAEGTFKVRFGLRGHLDAVRSVIFSGGGSPGEPEICTAGDDGIIKRWIIPGRYENQVLGTALDRESYFTHRGHTGAVMCLTSWSPSQNFAAGGRAQGDGWIFSGGQDATVRVWERGRVDPKATLDGHTDAVWSVCVLPGTTGAIFGQNNPYGGSDRIIVASGSADGSVKIWAVTAPPQLMSPQGGGRRGGRVRGNSMSSGSAFPSSPQPSVASNSPFNYTLVHDIKREGSAASPTSITPLSASGEAFVVSYSDAAVLVYDTRTGEEVASMQSLETYDATPNTSVNAIVATTSGLDGSLSFDSSRGLSEDGGVVAGATGTSGSVEGIIISGHEDRYIRFYDANSGQCTYNMLAHPAAISSLSLSPDGRELVSAGHDASLRFWSLEKRSCTQEITSHRLMRGEGVCSVVWSQDGRWVVSAGGDGVVKVFVR